MDNPTPGISRRIAPANFFGRIARPSFLAFGLALGCLADAHAQSGPTTGMVAYYPLDGNGFDAGPGQFHGTVIGAVPAEDRFGRPERAMRFSAGPNRIECGNPAAFNFASAFTLSAWVKLEQGTTTGYVISKYQFTSPRSNYSYGMGNAGNGNPYGFVSAIGGDYVDVHAPPPLHDGQWHAIALTYSNGKLTLYMDGIETGSRFLQLNIPSFSNAVPMCIGNVSDGALAWTGLIDDVRLFGRALSPVEVKDIYDYELNLSFSSEGLKTFDLAAGDLILNPLNNSYLASIRPDSAAFPNHLVAVDATVSSASDLGEFGPNLGKLAIAANGLMYGALNGSQSVRSYDTTTGAFGPAFSVGPATVIQDIEISPKSSQLIAVLKAMPNGSQQAHLYDNGIARPAAILNHAFRNIEFSPDGIFLYWRRAGTRDLFRATVDATGLVNPKLVYRGVDGDDFEILGDTVYFNTGEVLNLADRTRTVPFAGVGLFPSFSVRPNLQTIAFLSRKTEGWVIQTFNTTSLAPGLEGVVGVTEQLSGLTMASPGMMAFRSAAKLYFMDLDIAFAPRDLAVEGRIDPVPFTEDPIALQTFRYAFTVRNAGGAVVRNIKFRHTLPIGLTLKGAYFKAQPVTPQGRDFVIDLEWLLPGTTAELIIDAVPAVPGDIALSATATADGEDASPEDNTAAVLAQVKPAVTVSALGARWIEDARTNQLRFVLSSPVGGSVRVDYTLVSGTASHPSDFTTASGSTLIGPGALLSTPLVSVVRDTVAEPDEYLSVVITLVDGALKGIDSNTIELLDDDSPFVEVGGATAFEGEMLRFPVRLSQPLATEASVRYFIVGQTADPDDFTGAGGVVTFPAGQNLAEITVEAILDAEEGESDETIRVVLYDVAGANLLRSEAVGTIKNRTLEQAALRISGLALGSELSRVEFQARPSARYQLQYSPTLAPLNWDGVGPVVTAVETNTVIEAVLPGNGASGVYRVVRLPESK